MASALFRMLTMSERGTAVVRAFLLSVCAILVTGGCDRKDAAPVTTQVRVLAAASLANAFREAGGVFEAANRGVTLEFNFGGSNQIRTQLENGMPGDVFASADRKQMDAARASGVVDGATVRVLAMNRLTVIVPRANPAGIRGVSDLARPGVRIVVADPAVPAGSYTRQMLEKARGAAGLGPAFVDRFESNIRSREENVEAVVAKVALGEADAGIAYASDAAGGNGPRLQVVPLPPGLEVRADYLVAVAVRAGNRKLAERFVEFLGSGEAKRILETRGFTTPSAGTP